MYTCVHAGVLTPYVRRLLCVYAQRVLAIFSFFIVIIIQTLFRFFFPWRKVGGFRMAIVGVVCLHVCSTVVCVCLCGGMERVYLN